MSPLVFCLVYLPLFECLTLPIGNTPDDWSGWTLGDITTISDTSNKKYHGLFDGDGDEDKLSRQDIELKTSGTLTMNFTLIFACEIIDTLDKITVNVGTQSTDYYIVNTFGDYPYKSLSGFTVDAFTTDPLFNALCSNSSWRIQSSVTSTAYAAYTPIYIAFESSFNYSAPHDLDNKYWAVTDIEFSVVSKEIFQSNTANIILLIAISVILLLLIIPLLRYCYKGKKVRDKKRKGALLKTVSLQYTETNTNAMESELSEEYKVAINENNKLKSELAALQTTTQKLTTQNMSIDARIQTKESEFTNLLSLTAKLEHNIVEIENVNKAKQLELEQKIKERDAEISQNVRRNINIDDEWISLASFPTDHDICFVAMNYCEFGAVSWNENTRCIYKYGTSGKWILVTECSDDLESKYWIACSEMMSQRVFIYGDCGEMIVFDASETNMNITTKLNRLVVNGSQSVMINGRVHIFGAVDCWHLLWNKKLQMMKQLKTNMESVKNNQHFCVVALEKRNKLLLFSESRYDIYQYSLDDCCWNRLNVKLPLKMHSFGYTVSTNEEYMVLFGGVTDRNTEIDDIFILNLENMEFSRTKRKCPCFGKCRAFWMDYKEKYEIVLNRMIRGNIDKHIEQNIFEFIMMLVVTNDLHLLHVNTRRHWRINMNAIIDKS